MEKKRFWERSRTIREKKVRRRAGGKDLIHDETAMMEHITKNKVPIMMQHCIIKVQKKMGGSGREKFLSAYNICSAVFQNGDYLAKDEMRMTGKGLKNNRRHQRERNASIKKVKYKTIVERLWGPTIRRMRKEEKDIE